MTIHVITKYPTNLDDAELSVTVEGVVLRVSHTTSNATLRLSLSDLDAYAGGVVIYTTKLGSLVLASADDLIGHKELNGYLSFAKHAERPVAALIPNEQGTEAAALFYAKIAFGGETILNDKHCSLAESIDLVFPGYSDRKLKSRAAKVGLLTKLGAHDSLSALEKQVDLLTRLVLDLASRQYGDEQPDVSDALAQVLANGDSTSHMSAFDAATKIGEFKRRLRHAQAEYFAAREGK